MLIKIRGDMSVEMKFLDDYVTKVQFAVTSEPSKPSYPDLSPKLDTDLPI